MKEINAACWAQFIALLFLFFLILGPQVKNRSGVFHGWHCGFIYFYGIGQIVNEYPAIRIYDYSLQQKIFNEINPAPEGYYGPSPYPPFVALFFSLYARLPFNLAYVLWAGTSLTLYIAGIGAALREVFPGEPLKRSLIFCLALEFCPFIIFTLVNGQLASIAAASVGLAIFQESRSNPVRSGFALSILAYKPTLLLLLIPMLLLTRRFRTLFGFSAGVAILIAVATAFTGIQIWPAYAHFVTLFGKVAGVNGNSGLNLARYIDFSSFSHLVPGGRSVVGLTILICLISAVSSGLALLLWRSAKGSKSAQYLAWAATLTWTLLLNVYVPIWDTVLAVIAIILTLGALKDLKRSAATGWIAFLSLLIFAVSWVAEAFAHRFRIEPLTILIGFLGLAQLFLLHRAIQRDSMQTDTGILAK
jgi:hypothetical protein